MTHLHAIHPQALYLYVDMWPFLPVILYTVYVLILNVTATSHKNVLWVIY